MQRLTVIPVLVLLAACSLGQERSLVSDTQEVLASSDATTTIVESVESVEPFEPVEPVGIVEPIEAVEVSETTQAEPSTEHAQPSVPTAQFMLRRGESLAHFARWSELPIEDIATASNLELDGRYEVGTEVRVPISGEALSEVERLREQHRTRRVEGYLSSRGGAVGTDFHKVRTGESAWGIAKQHQAIPVWVLESYNPTVDLERLRPGQELMVPVIADVVVDADLSNDRAFD